MVKRGSIPCAAHLGSLLPVVTGKIALAHLKEFPDYYTRLARMEEEAKQARRSERLTTDAL